MLGPVKGQGISAHVGKNPIKLNANHLFVWHKMFVTGTICKQVFGPKQKIWTGTKLFATYKRTRQKSHAASADNLLRMNFWGTQ